MQPDDPLLELYTGFITSRVESDGALLGATGRAVKAKYVFGKAPESGDSGRILAGGKKATFPLTCPH